MVEEPGEGGVNLRKGEGRMVFVDRVGAPAVPDVLLRDLNDFDPGVVNPRGAGGVAVDVGEEFGGHCVRRLRGGGMMRNLRHLPVGAGLVETSGGSSHRMGGWRTLAGLRSRGFWNGFPGGGRYGCAMRLPFNEKKATQAAAYLLRLRGGRMSYMKLIKLLYLADRISLNRRGRPITTDRYVSMDRGPVLSRTLNLITEERDPAAPSFWAE